MKLGSGIRIAFVAAVLLAQLGLPALHGFTVAGEHFAFATAHGQTVAPAGATASASTHDPVLCPICLLSSQVRAGIARTSPLAALLRECTAITVPELRVAPPVAPERDSASPRAPPVRALDFA